MLSSITYALLFDGSGSKLAILLVLGRNSKGGKQGLLHLLLALRNLRHETRSEQTSLLIYAKLIILIRDWILIYGLLIEFH